MSKNNKDAWHLYLRGNFQNDMFYDQEDKINVWNRIWLSAAATGTQILSVAILDNHLHINVFVPDESATSDFMHHFRLSITQYHNRRYKVKGTLGTRNFGRARLKDIDDLKDCVCYHARNVLHHCVFQNFMDYDFSTARWVFDLMGIDPDSCFNRKTMPRKMWKRYLPHHYPLPLGWLMTQQGMIVPPKSVFRSDLLEFLFSSPENYLETLSRCTIREKENHDVPELAHPRVTRECANDEDIAEYIRSNCCMDIPSMNPGQKMEAVFLVIDAFPKVSRHLLSRLFGIPMSTLRYRIKNWHTHE